MTKREEAIGEIAFWLANDEHMKSDSATGGAIVQDHHMITAAVAFDAAIKVLMEPDEAMLLAAGKSPDGVTPRGGFDYLGRMLPRYWRSMLKAASA